jgi:alpha-mannosidase
MYRLNSADLTAPNLQAWALMYDFEALHQLSQHLPSDSVLANKALYVANEIMNVFREGDVASLEPCRKVAEQVLGKGWEAKVDNEAKDGTKQAGTLWGIGHWSVYPTALRQAQAAVISTPPGFGLSASPSKRSPVLGPPK